MQIDASLGDNISITTLNDSTPGPFVGTITGFCSYATAQAFSKPATIEIIRYHVQVLESVTTDSNIPTDASDCSYVLVTDNNGVIYPIALEWIASYTCTSDNHQYIVALTCTETEFNGVVSMIRKAGVACKYLNFVE